MSGVICLLEQQFENYDIRFVEHPESKYDFGVVAEDMAIVLDASSGKDIARAIDDDWKGAHNMNTPGGTQSVIVIWEPGVYQLLAVSRKPKAKPFQKWLYEVVLPSIRKTGGYVKNLSPSELLLLQAQRLVDLERQQQQTLEQLVEQKVQLAVTNQLALSASQVAQEAKDGLDEVRDQLSRLEEFAVAQPPGLEQDLADQINQAFQTLGGVLVKAGIHPVPAQSYKAVWRDLGLTMRNSTINYDLNARYANAKRKHEEAVQEWVDNGRIRGQKPRKLSRIDILRRDNMLFNAFRGAQQVIRNNLGRLTRQNAA